MSLTAQQELFIRHLDAIIDTAIELKAAIIKGDEALANRTEEILIKAMRSAGYGRFFKNEKK